MKFPNKKNLKRNTNNSFRRMHRRKVFKFIRRINAKVKVRSKHGFHTCIMNCYTDWSKLVAMRFYRRHSNLNVKVYEEGEGIAIKIEW